MAVKALFLTGKNTTSTESLYQWDYGQVLEIEAPDLGSMLCEVHFACQGMSEAIVRSCNLSAGVGTVTIPDDCLEQSAQITAWIYEKGATHGRTRCVISIPMIARARPRPISDDIPQSATDQYTLLIGEVNDAINNIEDGIVKAKYAGTADMATNAGYATAAGNASTANLAVSANSDAEGKELKNLLRCAKDGFIQYDGGNIEAGVLAIRVCSKTYSVGGVSTFIVETAPGVSYSPIYYDGNSKSFQWQARLAFIPVDDDYRLFTIRQEQYVADTNGVYDWSEIKNFKPTVMYQHLIKYPAQ